MAVVETLPWTYLAGLFGSFVFVYLVQAVVLVILARTIFGVHVPSRWASLPLPDLPSNRGTPLDRVRHLAIRPGLPVESPLNVGILGNHRQNRL